MITTIRLDTLLLEAHPAVPSRNLVTRSTGALVRTSIEREMDRRHTTVALLDFSDLDVVDLSCADEVVAKLLQRMDATDHRVVVLTGVSEEQAEAIDHVLSHHELGVQAVTRGAARPRLLGHFGDDSRQAFDLLIDLGAADTGRLAAGLGWQIDRVADALQVLCLLGVVIASGGMYQVVMAA